MKNRRPKTCVQCSQRGLEVSQDAGDGQWYCWTCLDAYARGDALPAPDADPDVPGADGSEVRRAASTTARSQALWEGDACTAG